MAQDTLSLIEAGLFQIYWAEKRILESLPEMAEKAVSPHLKQLFKQHELETRKQINRLEDVFDKLDIDYERNHTTVQKLLGKGKKILKDVTHLAPPSKEEMVQMLIEENQALQDLFSTQDPDIYDAVIAAGCEQIEQLEISSYVILIKLVQTIKHDDVEDLLRTNLEEEKHALQMLSQITSPYPIVSC